MERAGPAPPLQNGQKAEERMCGRERRNFRDGLGTFSSVLPPPRPLSSSLSARVHSLPGATMTHRPPPAVTSAAAASAGLAATGASAATSSTDTAEAAAMSSAAPLSDALSYELRPSHYKYFSRSCAALSCPPPATVQIKAKQ